VKSITPMTKKIHVFKGVSALAVGVRVEGAG